MPDRKTTTPSPDGLLAVKQGAALDSTLSAILASSEWITAVFGIHAGLSNRVYDMAGLTLTRYRVLLAINDAQQPLAAKRLAEILRVSASTVSAIINELSQRDFIRAVPNPRDRRSTLLDVTDAGRECLRAADVTLWSALRSYWRTLTPEERAVSYFGSGEEHMSSVGTWVSGEYLDMISMFRRGYAIWIDEACGLAPTQYRVVRLLNQAKTPLPVGTVASMLVLRQNTVSSVAMGLEKQGWLTRTSSSDDGRVVMLALTEAGDALAMYAYARLLHTVSYADVLRRYRDADLPTIWAASIKVAQELGAAS